MTGFWPNLNIGTYYFLINTTDLSFSINQITHMSRRWGTPQNFLLAFIDEL